MKTIKVILGKDLPHDPVEPLSNEYELALVINDEDMNSILQKLSNGMKNEADAVTTPQGSLLQNSEKTYDFENGSEWSLDCMRF